MRDSMAAMEMHQIRYFLAVCEHAGFSRAAEACGVTQPALTTAVKHLEQEIGGALFYREGRQVKYLRSTFVPDSGRCSCLFEAQDAATVELLNAAARIPYDRVAPALDLNP